MTSPNINFENDQKWQNFRDNLYYGEESRLPKLILLIMKLGLDKKQAYYVVAGILIISFFITYKMIVALLPPERPKYLEDYPQEQLDMMSAEERQSIPSRTKI